MKDAKGHGSAGRGGGSFGSFGGVSRPAGTGLGFSLAQSFKSKGGGMRPDNDRNTDTQRTVADLRGRMAGTGSGHVAGLMQGVKNLFGGGHG